MHYDYNMDKLSCNMCISSQLIFFTSHRSSESLDITLKGKYLITVTATDTGGLEATTLVEVTHWLKFLLKNKQNKTKRHAQVDVEKVQLMLIDYVFFVVAGFHS